MDHKSAPPPLLEHGCSHMSELGSQIVNVGSSRLFEKQVILESRYLSRLATGPKKYGDILYIMGEHLSHLGLVLNV